VVTYGELYDKMMQIRDAVSNVSEAEQSLIFGGSGDTTQRLYEAKLELQRLRDEEMGL
jgi:hypothetical protein